MKMVSCSPAMDIMSGYTWAGIPAPTHCDEERWTDLLPPHTPGPGTHGPWWFLQSWSRRPKCPPADSELSPTSVRCCQPCQAPICPTGQRLQTTQSRRRWTTVKLKTRDTGAARGGQRNWRESNTCGL